jgi:hypothetical protein
MNSASVEQPSRQPEGGRDMQEKQYREKMRDRRLEARDETRDKRQEVIG